MYNIIFGYIFLCRHIAPEIGVAAGLHWLARSSNRLRSWSLASNSTSMFNCRVFLARSTWGHGKIILIGEPLLPHRHARLSKYRLIYVFYSQETGAETGLGETKGTTGYFGGGVVSAGCLALKGPEGSGSPHVPLGQLQLLGLKVTCKIQTWTTQMSNKSTYPYMPQTYWIPKKSQ